MSDSDDAPRPPTKRIKRFTYKNFAQRINEVNVDIYRKLAPVKSEPHGGAASFFQEQLRSWRELNTAEHFTAAAKQLSLLSVTLPQLLHHRADIINILLDNTNMAALLSLEPLLGLLGTLSRDLQHEYLPFMPQVMDTLADLIHSGGDRHPEVLEHVFNCVATILKNLVKWLAADVIMVLTITKQLRYSSIDYVRGFAAECVGYLMRQATQHALKAAVRTLMADVVLQPTEERLDGVSALLAESMIGVQHGLHSKAMVILKLVVSQRVLQPEDFRKAPRDGATDLACQSDARNATWQDQGALGPDVGLGGAETDAMVLTNGDQEGDGGRIVCIDTIRGRCSAAAIMALHRVLEHIRRGKCEELQEVALQEVAGNIQSCGDAGAPVLSPLLQSRTLARSVRLLAPLLQYRDGDRVQRFGDFFDIVSSLVKSRLPFSESAAECSFVDQRLATFEGDVALLASPCLARDFLHLVTALVHSQVKVGRDHDGLKLLSAQSLAWDPLFLHSPALYLAPFLRSLIRAPAGESVARVFDQQILTAVGELLLNEGDDVLQLAWPLMVDLCAMLRPMSSWSSSSIPLLLTVRQEGVQLAAHVRGMVKGWCQTKKEQPTTLGISIAWCALQCLSNACVAAGQLVDICQYLIDSTWQYLQQHASNQPEPSTSTTSIKAAQPAGGQPTNDISTLASERAVLFLHCSAWHLMARIAPALLPERLPDLSERILEAVETYPGDYHVLCAAAGLLTAARESGCAFPEDRLKALLPLVQPNLCNPSQSVRRQTLSLLCCFEQPDLPQTLDDSKTGKHTNSPQASSVLQQLLRIESQGCTLNTGRQSSAVLLRLKSELEYGRVPPLLVPAVVYSLMGIMHIRFSVLWVPAAEALGMAIQRHRSVSWPLLFQLLTATQQEFISGHRETQNTLLEAQRNADAPVDVVMYFLRHLDSGSTAASGGCTDAATRMTHLLKAAVQASGELCSYSSDWLPLFLQYLDARPGEATTHTAASTEGTTKPLEGAEYPSSQLADLPDNEATSPTDQPTSGVSGSRDEGVRWGARIWRTNLKEWLAFIGGIKGLKGIPENAQLCSAVAQQLSESDAQLQQSVIQCLKAFKLPFLQPYIDQLLGMTDSAKLREVITTFRVASGGAEGLAEQHRAGFVPLMVRVLYPHMRKRSGKLSGKGAPGSARAAILNFLSSLEPQELSSLLELFLEPIAIAFRQPTDIQPTLTPTDSSITNCKSTSKLSVIPSPWWVPLLGTASAEYWMEAMMPTALSSIPLRRRVGVLNSLDDLLRHAAFKLLPFMPFIIALLLAFITDKPLTAGQNVSSMDMNDAQPSFRTPDMKELRTPTLRMLATIFQKFPDVEFGAFWDPLFRCIDSVVPNLRNEAASSSCPPLLDLCSSLACSPTTVCLLADTTQMEENKETHSSGQEASKGEWWIVNKKGSSLLSSAIGVLSSASCSEASRNTCLTMIETILELPEDAGQWILRPHAELLLCGLRCVILAMWDQRTKRSLKPGAKSQSGRTVALRALTILERVGSYLETGEAGVQLSSALLPLLQGGNRKGQSRSREVIVTRTLRALSSVWDHGTAGDASQTDGGLQLPVKEYRNVLVPLVSTLQERNSRSALCSAFEALSKLDHTLSRMATLLSDLNAWSTTEVEELDYERRIAAYAQLHADFWTDAGRYPALVLMMQCTRDLRNADDISLRNGAVSAMNNFITAVQHEVEACGSLTSACRGNGIASLLMESFFGQLKKGLSSSNLTVRQEHLTLLRQCVVTFPSGFTGLHPLVDQDPEVDFFHNIAHLQFHRRVRALNRLSKYLTEPESNSAGESSTMSVGTLLGVMVPLLRQFILTSTDTGKFSTRASDRDREANVVDAAIGTLAAVAGQLPWVQYQQLLGQFMREMKRGGKSAKVPKDVIRAVCAILGAFHFSVPADAVEGVDDSVVKGGVEDKEGDKDEGGEEDGPAGDEEAATSEPDDEVEGIPSVPPASITRVLCGRVLPALLGIMVLPGGEVRAPVALAAVKLLQLLPSSIMDQQLPGVLQKVANVLKSRTQGIRDDARRVLVSMSCQLGPAYLPYTLSTLVHTLPLKGYTAHVLGFTLHAVLEGVAKSGAEGWADECLQEVLPFVEAQIFGDVGDAQEAQEFGGQYREAKKNRGYDIFQQLAAGITVHDRLNALLAPVRDYLPLASSPKISNKISTLLQAAVKGLTVNCTTTPQALCTAIYNLLDDGLQAEQAASKKAKEASQAAVLKPVEPIDASTPPASLHTHLLIEFALTLLQSGLKKGTLSCKSPEILGLLDPLLPFVVQSLSCRHAATVSLGLRCMSYLIQMPLPGLQSAAPGAGKVIPQLLKRSPRTTHPVAQDCFKLLAGMLRTCQTYKPTNAQLRFILGWAFTDLEESTGRQTVFSLLKAILSRKLVVPEVYDIIGKVQTLMIQSHTPSLMELCSQVLLQFLLDYPVGPKRLSAHMQFLVTNLSYEHESGRLSALDMIDVICDKFPSELMSEWCDVFFLPLATRLVNDASSICRSRVAEVVKKLFSVTPQEKLDRAFEYCITWLGAGEGKLKRVAAQVVGLMVEVQQKRFVGRVSPLLPPLLAILADHADMQADLEIEVQNGNEEAATGRLLRWEELYYTCALLGKMVQYVPGQLSWQIGEPGELLWEAVVELLLYPHVWVRKVAGRAVGAALAQKNIGQPMLTSSEVVPGQLSFKLYRQLETPELDESLASQAVRSLLYIAPYLYGVDKRAGRVPSTLQRTQGYNGRTMNTKQTMLDVDRASTDMVSDDDFGNDENDDHEQNGVSEYADKGPQGKDGGFREGALSLMGLVTRMAQFADDKRFVRRLQRETALKFLAAFVSRLGQDNVQPYLRTIMRPLYRLSESGSVGTASEDVKQLGEEVMSHIRHVVGPQCMMEAYNAAREDVKQIRMTRKKNQALRVMLDPEANATAKIAKQKRRDKGRKRKLEELKRQRSAGVITKNKKIRRKERR